MPSDPNTPTQTPHPVTPSATQDPTNHQQGRAADAGGRPNLDGPAVTGAAAGQNAEPSVGSSAGSDTTGAVAPPGRAGQPGASLDLDGTPGALAPDSKGRQGNF